jgi:hypothetical protein
VTQTPFPDGLGFEIPPHERTPLVEQLLRIIAELREENRRLREELDRLRGLPPQPARKPSMLGSDRPPSAPTAPKRKLLDGKRPGSAKCHKTRKLEIHETIPLPPANLPPGAKKISHRDFIVQDIEIKNRNIRYRREVYLLPDGSVRTGELPAHVQGHFGTTLRAHILYQYYQNHITQPLIREELLDYGVVISVGQIDRILHHGHDKFHAEKESLLPAARELATHFHTDDTSARHRGQNYHTTGIGNESFAVFTTTPTKSRINFLELLCAPYQEYVVDGDTMEYLTYYDLPQRWLKRLRESIEDGERRIVIEGSQPWEQQLQSWGIIAEQPRQLITEAALWGCLMYHDFYVHQPILSDDAGQFKLLGYLHGLCWVHAERNVARVVPLSQTQHDALERVRDQIWRYYQRLKAYRLAPTPQKKGRLEHDFDAIFLQRTGFVELNEALARMHAKKEELLLVLEHPHLPLENNLCERDLREWAKTRKIHAGTRSDLGRRCRDTFLSLKKTCRKLGISFWEFLQDRLHGHGQILPLSQLMRRRAEQLA